MNYCVRCGNSLQTGNRFCGRCGHAVTLPAVTPQPSPSAMPSPQAGSPALQSPPLPSMPITGSSLAFLFAVSGCLIFLGVIGMGLFFTVGLSATLSEEKLSELGIDDCHLVDNPETVFNNLGLEQSFASGFSGETDVRSCQLEGISYYMYPASDFRGVFQSYVHSHFCVSFDNLRENMQAARQTLADLESSRIFQVGQYVFSVENRWGLRIFEEFFRRKRPADPGN